MRYSIAAHKTIAIASFLVLSYVQFFLLFNTYELKNDHYYLAEKAIINNDYSYAIRNDKVMPGGQGILDNYLVPNMKRLEELYLHDPVAFNVYKQKLCDSAFRVLRKANNIDSVLGAIIKKNNLSRNLDYALLIERVDVAFQHNKYVSLYNNSERYDLIDPALQTRSGIHIGGTLQDVDPRNLATALTVSSPLDYSSRVSFSLHVDIRNRKAAILRLMMPTFTLSLLSVLSVVLLFFITFRNWLRQKKLSEMKSDFINSITHEFHTPLAAIIVANKAMQNERIITSKEAIRPLTEVVQRQADRLKVLISQVLDLTTFNRIVLDKKEYSLHLLLDELLLDYRLKLTDASVAFILEKTAWQDIILLDRFWFTTIILNIFDNAVKYNDKEEKRISVTTFADRRFLYITIHDNGIGMSKEIQKHVFEKFYRNMRRPNDLVKGLGLGLYYVKRAVDAHGWKIELNSTEGEGSIFMLTISI